jgi:glyoxylase-like metal-dependent hydrolase (beta-lactamase superfamily II)
VTNTDDAGAPTPPGGDKPRPAKQEQQDASEEIIEVAPGVRRLQLPIDFTGLGHVNTYALEDSRGFALVDPGLPGEQSWKVLQARMDAAEIPLRHVHTVIVTHSHPDHFGGAGLLAERSGAEIVTSDRFRTRWDSDDLDDRELEPADESSAEQSSADPGTSDDPQAFVDAAFRALRRPKPWGGPPEEMPPERRAQMFGGAHGLAQWFRAPRPSVRLADLDHITLAGREWVGLFTPGHTDDHLCLFDAEEGVLLSGDHVLPTITPHISGLIEGDPLALYVESLDRIASLSGVRTVLPAHGQPFFDLGGRVDQIKEHHEERLVRIREICEQTGWATVEDLSHRLFAPRSWGNLAESETYAHLEHLRRRGEAERREEAGVLYFRA